MIEKLFVLFFPQLSTANMTQWHTELEIIPCLQNNKGGTCSFLKCDWIIEVGQDIWRSSRSTTLLKQGHPEPVAQDHAQTAFEYLQ